jgi:hypothetical protein
VPPQSGDARARLIETLQQMDRPFVVDNLETSSVSESPHELTIVAPKEACTMLRFSEGDLVEAAKRTFGRALGVKLVEGAASAPPASAAAPKRSDRDEELMERVLSDPAVQSFKEAFPGAEVRQVRNLKD